MLYERRSTEFRHLNLHLEMSFEVGQQGEEDGQRELKDFGDGGDAVFGQCHTQVLLNGVDEHLVGLEDGPCVLQDGQQQLQREHLGAQLMGPGDKRTALGPFPPSPKHQLDISGVWSFFLFKYNHLIR